MITAGISSILFAIVPLWFKLPLVVQYRMNKLALCSGIYHIYDNETQLTISKNTTMQKIVECLDGMAIILCSGGYFLDDKIVTGLLQMYVSMKMVSNNDLIKQTVYFSTVLVVTNDTPYVFIPWVIGARGLYNYFECNKKWNHINRTVWHLGNSIFIGLAYLHKA
jgi:hypothetical protein